MKEYVVKVFDDGSKYWYLNGERHREDGPAIEWADGYKSWWLNGNFHREDGPAFESASGTKKWYLNDELHREDGPAIEFADGTKYWFLNGNKLTEEEFNAKTQVKELSVAEIQELLGFKIKVVDK